MENNPKEAIITLPTGKTVKHITKDAAGLKLLTTQDNLELQVRGRTVAAYSSGYWAYATITPAE